jgi:hypothetical protein
MEDGDMEILTQNSFWRTPFYEDDFGGDHQIQSGG